jgi:hypothetical protein
MPKKSGLVNWALFISGNKFIQFNQFFHLRFQLVGFEVINSSVNNDGVIHDIPG